MSTVVITGGSRGIGRAAVELFAGKGYRVFFLYEKNDAAAREVSGKTGAVPIRCDVADSAAVKAAFRQMVAIFLLLLLAGGIWAYHAGLFTGSSSTLEFEDLDSLPWNLILVNQDHAIPDNWSQELTTLSNGTQVDSRIYPELQQMFDDMRAQGVYPVVASGYRSAEKQQSLMDDKIQEFEDQGESPTQAQADAKLWVNPVGYSEHQTGLALDVIAPGGTLNGFKNTQQFVWMRDNAHRFGFILRYGDGMEYITGYKFEPWHYRYVGREHAEVIRREGLTLEEYLYYYK